MYNYNFLNNSSVDKKNHRNVDIFGGFNDMFGVINTDSGMNSSDMNNGTNTNMNTGMNATNNMSNMNTPSLTSPGEGFMRGNLFNNLYDQYKNYQPRRLNASNDRERLFNEMSENAFAAHELNLYLDLYPEDSSILTLFNDYRTRTNALKEEYENMYGPISISSDSLNNTPFLWQTMSWPWEGVDN